MSGDNLVQLDDLRNKARLAGAGGGSDDGGMLDTRVAALETDMREVKGILARIEKRLDSIEARLERFDDRLRTVEMDLARIDGRVSQMPTTWTLVTTGFGMVLSTCGLMFAILRFGLATP